jgi:hypothetical protein
MITQLSVQNHMNQRFELLKCIFIARSILEEISTLGALGEQCYENSNHSLRYNHHLKYRVTVYSSASD